MRLRDMKNIFDIPMSIIQTYAVRYKTSVILCMVLDGLLAIVCGILLMYRGDILTLVELSILIAVIINFIIVRSSVKSEYNNVFRFYLKSKNSKISIKTYSVSENELYSVLSSMGVSGKSGKTFELYIEVLNNCCIRSIKNAKKVVKLLKPFENKDGNIKLYVTSKDVYVSLVSCMEEEKNEYNN